MQENGVGTSCKQRLIGHRTSAGRTAGFTLVEILVALTVVAILASIAYPSYQDHMRKGRRAAAQAFMVDAASRFGPGVLAVILTGRLSDGAEGVRAVRRAGGMVLVQDPADCAAAGMPTAALSTGCVEHRLPLRVIGPALVALTMVPGAAELYRVPLAPWASLEAPGEAQAGGSREAAAEVKVPATAA